MKRPLLIELYAGSFGWSAGWLELGGRSIGFDIEHLPHHGPIPAGAELVLQDCLTLHGKQFRDADLILASPPCQAYSWMAMPWSRAKKMAAEYRDGTRSIADLNARFDACFRIQREASEAAGHHVPMVVENVKGAQPWVGRAKWHSGPYFLWGDVPALMPPVGNRLRKGCGSGRSWFYENGGNCRSASSRSAERRMWSAQVAKIPFELSLWIAQCFKPT